MPPTPTVPVPTPTQTVELRIPQDVLDRLRPPDPGFWSQFGQPLATVFGALFVLAAAALAYRSAMKSISAADDRADREQKAASKRASDDRAAAAQAQRDLLEAQAATRKEDREAARAEARRGEKRDALVALIEALREASTSALDLSSTVKRHDDWSHAEVQEAFYSCLGNVRKAGVKTTVVRYFGCADVNKAAKKALDIARELALVEIEDEGDRDPDVDAAEHLREELSRAIGHVSKLVERHLSA